MSSDDTNDTTFTKKRWESILNSLEIKFRVDDDGDYFADWDGIRVWFYGVGEKGEILVIRAMWDIRPPAEAYERLALEANRWNSDAMWPRASVYVSTERGECLVMGDMNIDAETGVSDDFLRQQVRCMLATSNEFFEKIASTFPEHTGWRN
ncbi:MAG: hypothetical protein CR979_03495, partial [Propionibacterium sp.]